MQSGTEGKMQVDKHVRVTGIQHVASILGGEASSTQRRKRNGEALIAP